MDGKRRRTVERLRARIAVDLAGFYADFDRPAAARLVFRGCRESWRFAQWWKELPGLVLKMLAPRALLSAYRRRGPGRSSAGAQPQG